METTVGIGDYLIEQIQALGVRHVFGVPGDYVLNFYRKLEESPLKLVNTCDEQGAGFAADAYARLTGLGVVCVTYGVGGLKVANTTAEAYAERVPVLIISGAPGHSERSKNPLLHHKVNQFDTQKKIFEQITVASTDLRDPDTALAEIDRVLAAIIRYKRPGYIELPRDMVSTRVPLKSTDVLVETILGEPEALDEALSEAVDKINASDHPVILVGEECYRFGLQDSAIQLAEKAQIPLAVTLLGKSAVPETHPQYMGVYAGALGDEDVRSYVENSDCLILAGVLMTDMNLGVFSAHIDPQKSVFISADRVTIAHHTYEDVGLRNFLPRLLARDIHPCHLDWVKKPPSSTLFTPQADTRVTVKRFFEQINAFLDCDMVVIADVGDALFGSINLVTCRAAQFLSPAFYASLGFAVPASIGVQMSDASLRPLVLVGDGAFQMTGMELSTAARYGLNPIVVVLNNKGYATERPMIDGPFNDILPWNYSKLPEVLGCGTGIEVETEVELQQALVSARGHTASFSIIDVKLDPHDISPSLQQLTAGLAKKT
jgi:TPP-dependent 2-oxoacid decarboxylase